MHMLYLVRRRPPHLEVTIATMPPPTPKPYTPRLPHRLEVSRNKLEDDWPVRELPAQGVLSNSLEGEAEPHGRQLPQKVATTHMPLDNGQSLVGMDWDPEAITNNTSSSSLEKLGGSFDVQGYLGPQHMDRGGGDPMAHFNFNQVASDNTPPNRVIKDLTSPR